jgi:uracil-DNA glycosylase
MDIVDPVIETSWKAQLMDEFHAAYFQQLKEFLLIEKKSHVIYPPGNRIFAAFDLTPFYQVKVVILGQDPYHGSGQAHGLCFSVSEGIDVPPSLKNIFKEIHQDLGIAPSLQGDLEKWAKQGVLLLNATLTVRAGQAGSHQRKGWETFTDVAIRALSDHREHLVFLLWGNYARAKSDLINPTKHLILTAAHPSPFSAERGFFGCRHFSKTNQYLNQHGIEPINWSLL